MSEWWVLSLIMLIRKAFHFLFHCCLLLEQHHFQTKTPICEMERVKRSTEEKNGVEKMRRGCVVQPRKEEMEQWE